MGTNFYFTPKTELFSTEVYRFINHNAITVNEIHIGKTSYGWKPVFESNNCFTSVQEIIEFYKKTKDIFKIIDEYNNKYTFEEFVERVIHFNADNNDALSNYEQGYADYQDDEGYDFIRGEFS